MHEPLRYRFAWLLVGWALIGTVVYFSLMPSPPQPLDLSDKSQHFLAYAAMAAWFLQLYRSTYARIAIGTALVLLGIAIEFLQGMGGVRQFDYADMMANAAGVLTSLVVVRNRLARVIVGLENWLCA